MPDATLIPLNEASGPLVCLSHLRWDFVLQRPQHLMGRFARTRDVYVWEEPVATAYDKPFYEVHPVAGSRVRAIRPAIPDATPEAEREAVRFGQDRPAGGVGVQHAGGLVGQQHAERQAIEGIGGGVQARL